MIICISASTLLLRLVPSAGGVRRVFTSSAIILVCTVIDNKMEQKSSLSSSLLRALFNSFSGIARSIGVSESNTVLNKSKVKQKKAKLRVTNHKRSDRIDFNSSCLPEIQNIVSSTMRFCSTNHKHGDIFKSQDRAVTVTVYASTSTMHIQGTNYPNISLCRMKKWLVFHFY